MDREGGAGPRRRSGEAGRGPAAVAIMSVALRNAQRVVLVRRALLRRAVCALRAALGASRFDVGLVCAGNGLMQRLNGAYRQRLEPTDVLSFPFHQVVAGELPRPRCRDEYNLGDIFLGVEYIHQQCRATGEDFDSVLVVSPATGSGPGRPSAGSSPPGPALQGKTAVGCPTRTG